MYDIKDEDIDLVASQSQLSAPQSTPLQMQLPVIELLKVSRFFLVADNIFESRYPFYLLLIWFLQFPDFVFVLLLTDVPHLVSHSPSLCLLTVGVFLMVLALGTIS